MFLGLVGLVPKLTAGRYGTVLAKQKNEDEAIKWFLRSANLNPWHWGAWEELSGLISNVTEVRIKLYLLNMCLILLPA